MSFIQEINVQLQVVRTKIESLEKDSDMKEKDFNFWKRQLETLQNEKLMLLDLLSKQILHELSFGENACADEYLKRSIQFVNNLLKTKQFSSLYDSLYKSDKAPIVMKITKINFSKEIPKDYHDKHVLAWVHRVDEPKEIFINQIFKERLDILSVQKESGDIDVAINAQVEEEAIIFFLGTLIIHELGHLLMRWSGHLSSPSFMTYDISKAAEAGFYLEYKLFESVVKLIIPSKPGRSVFNKYTQINGVSISKPDGRKLVHLKIKDDYINKAINNELDINKLLPFELEYNPISSTDFHTLSQHGEENDEDINFENEQDLLKKEETTLEGICVQI